MTRSGSNLKQGHNNVKSVSVALWEDAQVWSKGREVGWKVEGGGRGEVRNV